MPVPLESLPLRAIELTNSLHTLLTEILGDDLVAMWVFGGTTFAERPKVPGDLDVCVVVGDTSDAERQPDAWAVDENSLPFRLASRTAALARANETHIDVLFVLASEAEHGGDVSPAFWAANPMIGWPVVCSHLLAGQFVPVAGPAPSDLLAAPSSEAFAYALDREVEHLERHMYDGDNADPYEATYAMLNGCRVLHTVITGSPVVSKRAAGLWGLTNLPAEWHTGIRQAERVYDGMATDAEKESLSEVVPRFVAWVREQVPVTRPRPDGPPRWS